MEERAVTLDTVTCPDSKYVVDIFKVQILRKFGLQRLERGNVWAKCEVIVASSAQTVKRVVFLFMNERGEEVSKLIEDGGTYYITEVMVSRPNEVVRNRKFDLRQWHGFCYRAPDFVSLVANPKNNPRKTKSHIQTNPNTSEPKPDFSLI